MAIPKQRGGSSGRGGSNHRDSYRGFRNSGGNVKPPKKGCALFLFIMLLLPLVAGAGIWEMIA